MRDMHACPVDHSQILYELDSKLTLSATSNEHMGYFSLASCTADMCA